MKREEKDEATHSRVGIKKEATLDSSGSRKDCTDIKPKCEQDCKPMVVSASGPGDETKQEIKQEGSMDPAAIKVKTEDKISSSSGDETKQEVKQEGSMDPAAIKVKTEEKLSSSNELPVPKTLKVDTKAEDTQRRLWVGTDEPQKDNKDAIVLKPDPMSPRVKNEGQDGVIKNEPEPQRIKTEVKVENGKLNSLGKIFKLDSVEENAMAELEPTPAAGISMSVLPQIQSNKGVVDPFAMQMDIESEASSVSDDVQMDLNAESQDPHDEIAVPVRTRKRAAAADGSVQVKIEDADVVDMSPRKRSKIFSDAVEPLRREVSPDAQVHLQPLTEEVRNQMERLANPIVKIKKETEMSVESVVYRLNAIGLNPFPVSLPDHTRRKTVTRDWVSKQYGGPAQGGCPSINRKRFKHKMILRFFDFDFNPHLPKNPGDPGLVFYGVGKAYEWGVEPEEVFVRLSVNNWLYIGSYRMFVAESLTAEEWKQQSPEFKAQWCRTIKNGGGGSREATRALRINVDLHHRLGRRPTAAETKKAFSSSKDYLHLTEAQINVGFEKGQAKIAVWTMKCVGYREDVQRNIAGRIPTGWAK